jgi:hypothetical protein
MSANLDLVRSIYADWERGDFSWTDWADPEIEFEFADGLEPRLWRGLAGMADGWSGFLGAWVGFSVVGEAIKILGAGGFSCSTTSADAARRGIGSWADATEECKRVPPRDGRITRLVLYWDCERAFADLGLSPEGDAGGPTN